MTTDAVSHKKRIEGDEYVCLLCKRRWGLSDDEPLECTAIYGTTTEQRVNRMWLDTSRHRGQSK